jgi:hypothetical protein
MSRAMVPTDADLRPTRAPADRSETHDLHRSAARLAESAQEVRAAAGTPGCAAAIAPSLGCVEATLADLEQAVTGMEAVAAERLEHAALLLGGRWNDVTVARSVHEFQELARALANARRACAVVRHGAGPSLAELTAV